MKRTLLLAMLLLSIGLESYTCWEENGKAVRIAPDLNYSDTVIQLNEGSIILVWSDATDGLQHIQAQRISEEGENIWEEPLLLTDSDSYYPYNINIKETSDGEIVVGWFEREGPTKLRIQRIDTDGNLLWGESGLTIELLGTMKYPPLQLEADDEAGIYLVWIDNSSYRNIRDVRLDSSGNPCLGWSAGGNTISSYGANSYQLTLKSIPDGFGGIVLLYKYNLFNYVLQRVDSDGNLLWGEDGIYGDDMNIYGKFLFFNWTDEEYALILEDDENYWFNSIGINGQFVFEEWQRLTYMNLNQATNKIDMTITTDGKLGLIYSVIENNNTFLEAQKIMPGEEPDWGIIGIVIDNDQNNYSTAQIASAPDGGIYVNWDATGDEDQENLFYMHMDAEGNSLTGTAPIVLSSSEKGFYSIENIVLDTGIACVWSQYDQGMDQIKIQIFDSAENPVCGEIGNLIFELLSGGIDDVCRPAGNDDHTSICWSDSRDVKSQLYIQIVDNIMGEFLFGENGIPVILNSSLYHIHPRICVNTAGNTCITFKEYSDERSRDVVQIIDLEGNRILGDEGAIINQNSYIENGVYINAIESGFLLVWDECYGDIMYPDRTLKAQKIESNQFVWDEDAVLVEDTEYKPENIIIYGNYICWAVDDGIDQLLKMIRIDEDGSVIEGWENGILISQQKNISKLALYQIDNDILVLWEGTPDNTEMKLWGQRISCEGEFLWETEGRILVENYEDLISFNIYEGHLYCVLYGSFEYYYLDKYNLTGSSVWSVLTLITDSSSEVLDHFSVYENFTIVYYTNSGGDIYAKIYDPEGYTVDNLPPDGIAICAERHTQFLQSCLGCDNGNNISIWKDHRGEDQEDQWDPQPGLYIQAIDASLVPNTIEELPSGNLVNLRNYPNPFMQSTTLKCDLPRGIENAKIVIYNIRGQKVKSIPATSNEVQWDCRNQEGKFAGSGVYFYVLQGKNIQSKTGKMIMLR